MRYNEKGRFIFDYIKVSINLCVHFPTSGVRRVFYKELKNRHLLDVIRDFD